MALPTSLPYTADAAYRDITDIAMGIVVFCQSMLNELQNPIPVLRLVHFYDTLRNARLRGANIQAVPGLADYAKQATGDENYDIVAEFTAVVIAGEYITGWLEANLPTDGNGGIVTVTLVSNMPTEVKMLAPETTATLLTLTQALVNAIQH